MRLLHVLPLALTSLSVFATAAPQNSSDQGNEPPMLGIHWQRGVERPVNASGAANQKSGKTPSCSDCVYYHGGNVMPRTRVIPIYWGTSWSNPSFVQDKITGLDTWYMEYPGSDYESATMSEYCEGSGMTGSQTCSSANPSYILTAQTNNYISGVTFDSSDDYFDPSAAASGSKTANILKEVCSVIQARIQNWGLSPTTNDYYPVYVDLPVSSGFCAYHSYGTCSYKQTDGSTSSVTIQFGFFWNADGNVGCASGDGPYATPSGGSYPVSTKTDHSEGLGSLVDSTVHELSETRTDPGSPTAWIDANGQEVGDKCEWNTGYPGQNLTNGVPVVQFGSSLWVMQPEWSNKAALAFGTTTQFAQQGFNKKGSPSGSYGCVYGTGPIGSFLTFE